MSHYGSSAGLSKFLRLYDESGDRFVDPCLSSMLRPGLEHMLFFPAIRTMKERDSRQTTTSRLENIQRQLTAQKLIGRTILEWQENALFCL